MPGEVQERMMDKGLKGGVTGVIFGVGLFLIRSIYRLIRHVLKLYKYGKPNNPDIELK